MRAYSPAKKNFHLWWKTPWIAHWELTTTHDRPPRTYWTVRNDYIATTTDMNLSQSEWGMCYVAFVYLIGNCTPTYLDRFTCLFVPITLKFKLIEKEISIHICDTNLAFLQTRSWTPNVLLVPQFQNYYLIAAKMLYAKEDSGNKKCLRIIERNGLTHSIEI
jgi:hypothetical protein